MSPEEACAGEEVLALERRVYVIPRDGIAGPELFIRMARADYVIPLGPVAIAQLAEYCTAHMGRLIRRATLEEANGGG